MPSGVVAAAAAWAGSETMVARTRDTDASAAAAEQDRRALSIAVRDSYFLVCSRMRGQAAPQLRPDRSSLHGHKATCRSRSATPAWPVASKRIYRVSGAIVACSSSSLVRYSTESGFLAVNIGCVASIEPPADASYCAPRRHTAWVQGNRNCCRRP